VAWHTTAATAADGWAAFDLPPPPATPSAGDRDPVPDRLDLTVTAASDVGSHATPAGHFVVRYPAGAVTAEQAAAIGAHLELAHQTVCDLGFRADRSWPVSCLVLTDTTDEGGFTPSPRGADHGTLDIDAQLLDDPEELAATCGHEVFHLFQYFYDPRPEPARALPDSDRYWLDEAVAVWSEELFVADEDHVPAERAGAVDSPLAGILADEALVEQGRNGHGLSALPKYLFDVAQLEQEVLIATYEAVRQGQHPVNALDAQIPGTLAGRWVPFLRLLLTGGLYGDFTGATAAAASSAVVEIRDDSFQTATLTASLAELGSTLCTVRLAWDEMPPNAFLAARAEAPDTPGAHLSAFAHAGPEAMQIVASGADSLVVDDLRGLVDTGRDLVVVVTSKRLEGPPFTEPVTVSTTLSLRERLDLSTVNTGLVELVYVANWGGGDVVPDQPLDLAGRDGSYEEGTFEAVWDETGPDGWRDYGYFYVSLDPSSGALQTWAAERREDNDELDIQRIYRASGGPAPLEEFEVGSVSWRESGAAVAASVDFVFVSEIDGGNVTRFLQGFGFDDVSSSFCLRLQTED
jgi:hypothetical protein